MSPSLSMSSKSYAGIGRCLYCGEAFPDNKLTDEHIVPLALNGSRIFRKAACQPCARRSNSAYENPALQSSLLIPRLLLELKRRDKKRPKKLPPVAIGDAVMDSQARFDLELQIAQYPPHFALMLFTQPGKLVGINRSGNLEDVAIQVVRLPRVTTLQSGSVTTQHTHNHTAFALTVAKIALCNAVAERGLDTIDVSELQALLQGRRDDVYNFVGSAEESFRSKSQDLHHLSLYKRGDLWVARVHLFGSFATVPYLVVLGPDRRPHAASQSTSET